MAATQYYATGRRKEATARVFLRPGSGNISVNYREFKEFFPIESTRVHVKSPLVLTETTEQFDVLATVSGGGVTGQAGAIRLGIARALCEFNAELRARLKKDGSAHARCARQGAQEVRDGRRPEAVPVQQTLDPWTEEV